jgi:hypothetical protein
LAATIKITEGAEWSNSLLDPNTFEWQDLADKIKREVKKTTIQLFKKRTPKKTLFKRIVMKMSLFTLQLTETYRNSLVGDAFDRIDIEAFSKGSVLVDYYVYFNSFDEQVRTDDLKGVLNQQMERDGRTMLGRFNVDPKYTDFIGEFGWQCRHSPFFVNLLG